LNVLGKTSISHIGLAGLVLACVGCGPSGTQEKYSPPELKAMREKEMAPEMKKLEELEKKLGKDNSQVKQMRMELGLDPFPGSGQK
jgi:hypothetical protein